MMQWKVILWVCVVLVALAARANATANIARGKPYTFSKKPNYSLCTDKGDKTDLTDGVRTLDRYWVQKSTVGWQRARGPVAITIDLGRAEPILGAAVGTAGGSAGVTYPHSIVVSVSDDGQDFRVAGDLVRLSEGRLPAPGYGESDERGAIHTYRTRRLPARGRYVRFDVVLSGNYFFTDEIEIYRGSDGTPAADGPALTEDYVTDRTRLTQLGCYRRIRRDTELITEAVLDSAMARGARANALRELAAVTAANEAQAFPASDKGFRAEVPLNPLHERAWAVYGRLLADRGADPLTLWHTHPYQLLSPLDAPAGGLSSLNVDMMLAERRAEVINITNASRRRRQVRVRLSGIAFARVQQVAWIDGREGRVVGSALLPVERNRSDYIVSIPAGMMKQLWLSFEPTDVKAGAHVGKVALSAEGFEQSVDVTVNVAPLRFPKRPSLAVCTWDYIFDRTRGITASNQAQAKAVLLDGLVSDVWSTRRAVPMPSREHFNAEGNLIKKLDYTKWDAYVAMFAEARTYAAFVSWEHERTRGAFGFARGTPEFERAVGQWAAAWARHNRKIGLKPKQAMILFDDEPRGDAITWSRTIADIFRAGSDEIAIFNDPHIRAADHKDGPDMFAASDVVCLNLPQFRGQGKEVQDAYRALPAKGTKLYFYSCSGPTRMFDPSYFRLHAWRCFAEGATGQGFWAFGDTGGTSNWNEYAAVARPGFSPAYIGPDLITTSKHWEAVREGVQDYEYLRMLADIVARRERAGDGTNEVRRARNLVDTLARGVVDRAVRQDGRSYFGRWRNHSALADEARLNALKALTALQAGR